MNGKKNACSHYLFIFCILVFCSCRTIPASVPDNGTGAIEVRDDLATIASGQTELAITSTEIENGSESIENGLDNLEQSIISGTASNGSFEDIIREIRSRKKLDYIIETE